MNRWLKNITHFVIGVVLAFAIAEFLLSNFQFRMPRLTYKNSVYGWVPRSGEKLVWGNEGFGKFKYNSDGFLDKEIGPKKDGVYRVIVLGDSHTEARQVPYGKRFTELAEKYTNEKLSKSGVKEKVEIINLGVSGQSVADYIYYAKSYADRYQPDLVLIEVAYQDFLGDATDGSKSIYIANDNGNFALKRNENYFSTQSQSRLLDIVHHYQGSSAILDDVINRLPYHLQSVRTDLKEARGKAKSLKNPDFDIVKPFSAGKDEKNNSVPYPPGYEPGNSEKNGKLIDYELTSLIKGYGRELVFLELPFTPNLDEKGNVRLKEPVEDYWRTFIFKKLQNYNIEYIDPKASYVDLWQSKQILSRGFENSTPGSGHLNMEGHMSTADNIADYLTKKVTEVAK